MFESSRYEFYQTIPLGETTHAKLDTYLHRFGVEATDLSGKRILDIGGGVFRNFAKKVAESGGPIVTTLEPRAVYEETQLDHNAPVVAGVADRLPFKNKSFDLVVSNLTVPMWLTSEQEFIDVFAEIDRVLVDCGEARLYPSHHTVFWNRFLRKELEVPEDLVNESKAYIALYGLRLLGIKNLELQDRVVDSDEIFALTKVLVYRKQK